MRTERTPAQRREEIANVREGIEHTKAIRRYYEHCRDDREKRERELLAVVRKAQNALLAFQVDADNAERKIAGCGRDLAKLEKALKHLQHEAEIDRLRQLREQVAELEAEVEADS